uniref:Uncharacterized protein n=1 Tax=Anguilla anguilla TaxID=7936 RepID=A0A0E9PYT9_ANGAN
MQPFITTMLFSS